MNNDLNSHSFQRRKQETDIYIYIYIYILKTVCNKIVPMLALGRRALNTIEGRAKFRI